MSMGWVRIRDAGEAGKGGGCGCVWCPTGQGTGVDRRPDGRPAPESGGVRARGECVCARGEDGVCHSACSTRGSECQRTPLSGVRLPRWPGVGAVAARERWVG
jgi:hypothetical protein